MESSAFALGIVKEQAGDENLHPLNIAEHLFLAGFKTSALEQSHIRIPTGPLSPAFQGQLR